MKLGDSLLEYGPHRKSTPQPPRPPSPDDVEAPPQGSSDEAGNDEDSDDSELGLSRATKRRKKSHERAFDNGIVESGELPTAPSNIRSSSFTTSQRSKLDDDHEDPFSSQARSSQPRKPGKTYTKLKNIHKAAQKTPETKACKKQSNVANDDKTTGFRIPDINGLCAKGKSSYEFWVECKLKSKQPTKMDPHRKTAVASRCHLHRVLDRRELPNALREAIAFPPEETSRTRSNYLNLLLRRNSPRPKVLCSRGEQSSTQVLHQVQRS